MTRDELESGELAVPYTLSHALNKIRAAGQAKYVNGRLMLWLGGDAITLTISLDAQKSWPNGILENSRYAKFHIAYDGIMELISGHGMAKFRKTNIGLMKDGPVTAAENIADRIKKWLTASLAMQVARTESYMAQISKDVAHLQEDHAGNLPNELEGLANQITAHLKSRFATQFTKINFESQSSKLQHAAAALKAAATKLRAVDKAADRSGIFSRDSDAG